MFCKYCQAHGKCAWEADGARLPRVCPVPLSDKLREKYRTININSWRTESSNVLDRVCLATCHFNPCGYARLRDTYYEWRQSLGVYADAVVCAELVLDDDEPEIEGSIVIRGTRKKHVLWQKEAMLNHLRTTVAKKSEFFCWIDHDLVIAKQGWLDDAVSLLEGGHDAVQLFSSVRFLDLARRVTKERVGAVNNWASTGIGDGSPGGAWIASTKFLSRMDGLFDLFITGCGDQLMLDGLLGLDITSSVPQTPASLAVSNAWLKKAQRVSASRRTTFLPVPCYHLFHGTHARRQYRERHEILLTEDYDPRRDIVRTKEGLLEWRDTDNPLVGYVSQYFAGREEDNQK